MKHNFAAFILSHGRADNVRTYETLRQRGYTGPIVIIIDDTDKQQDQYRKKFGDQVYVFNKQAVADTTDQGDNFNNLRTTTHVRNAIFDAAEDLGYEYFVMLDDDYTDFRYKFSSSHKYGNWLIKKNLDRVFEAMIDYMAGCDSLKSIAFAQGGDFIGGENGNFAKAITTKRKCMNSFFCCTKRRFKFFSRLNEDVNTYVSLGRRGDLFLTTNQVGLNQMQTQTNSGGMSDAYLDSGTYVKSFYTVMYAPSCTTIQPMGSVYPRLHHKVNWRYAVPKILRST